MAGRIVVGVDGSEHAASALRWALEEAGLRDALVEAVHAWNVNAVATPADAGLVPVAWSENTELVDATRSAAERLARDQVRTVAGEDERVSVSVVQGEPTDVLLAAAEDADLLVVGNRGHGHLMQVLFGSTSSRLSDRSHCPVVVVHGDAAA
jgi:nucleotide-binding universal stress UspA family protein